MSTILLRILFVHNIINTILLYFVPKKLRNYLPCSWYKNQEQQPLQQQRRQRRIDKNILVETNSTPSPPPSSQVVVLSRMDHDELQRVFQLFDHNGDGRITKQELNDSLEKMGILIPDVELTQMIEKIDFNGDGCVDVEEFGALYQSIMDEHDEEEDMKEAFNVFDQNGDGFITVDELKSVLVSLGLNQGRTVEDCRVMIKKVDVDGDGMVDYNEFKQMMRGGGFATLTN